MFTCTSYPHSVPWAHAAPTPASLFLLHTQDLSGPSPCHPALSTGDAAQRRTHLLVHCFLFRSPSFLKPRPLLHLQISRLVPSLCFSSLSRPSWLQFPGAVVDRGVHTLPCVHMHTQVFSQRAHTLLHMLTLLLYFPLGCSLPCSFTCSQSPKHIYTCKLTLPNPPSVCRCSHLQAC